MEQERRTEDQEPQYEERAVFLESDEKRQALLIAVADDEGVDAYQWGPSKVILRCGRAGPNKLPTAPLATGGATKS